MQLPPRGIFRNLEVNSKGELMYVRAPAGSRAGPTSCSSASRTRARREGGRPRAGSFQMTPDGKKILVPRGSSANIHDAAGASGKAVVTTRCSRARTRESSGRASSATPRVMRDFFYDPTMHGVDWDKVLTDHLAMLPDAVTRDDVSYIIQELISELNVGHAYYRQGRDAEATGRASTSACSAPTSPRERRVPHQQDLSRRRLGRRRARPTQPSAASMSRRATTSSRSTAYPSTRAGTRGRRSSASPTAPSRSP